MRRTNLAKTVLVAAVCLGPLALASNAMASPMSLVITVTDLTTPGSATITYTDAGTPNTISVSSGSLLGISFTGELSQSIIGPLTNTLFTDATTITNNSLTDTYQIVASVTGFNFVGPDNLLAASASGTWLNAGGSIMSLSWYDDPTNSGLATIAELVDSFTSAAAVDPTSSYAYNPGTTSLANPDTGLFSMTEAWTYTLAPGAQLINRGQTEVKSESVPEPASLALLASGLISFGTIRRRRRA